MNLAYFISKRINKSQSNSFSSTIHKIAVASIAIGLGIMIISFLILGGFQETIMNKIFSFGGHLQVTKYTFGNGYGENPISVDLDIYQNPKDYDFIKHVQEFSYKPGLLKTEEEVFGVILKGIGKSFDTARFSNNIVKGQFISFDDSTYSTDVMLSQKIANVLKLDVGDEVIMYFIQNPPRFRKLNITGIYDTGLEDFDEKVIIGDIALIQRLNSWPDSLVGGVEIFVKDFDKIKQAEEKLVEITDFDLYVEKISDRYIQIFDWLSLLNKNVIIFLTLILFVACFNMISILLILIMERTQMIGILKAVGANDRQIQNIFMYNGIQMIVRGLIWGNFIGIGFGLLQDYFKIIPLDPENYYMSFVPIEWNWSIILGMNLLIFVMVSLVLIIPTMIISRINPIKAIHFD